MPDEKQTDPQAAAGVSSGGLGNSRAEVSAALRRAGLRVTAPRLAVFQEVRHRPHATVEELAEGARRRVGAVSTQAVYDIVAALQRAGLVRCIEPAGHAARYETRVADNHHHVICRGCGAIADVDCAVGAMPCLEPSSPAGFTIDEAEVNFWGWCPSCREGGVSATHPAHLDDTAKNE